MAAAHAPATLWATQSAMLSRGYRLIGVIAVYFLVLLAVALVLRFVGMQRDSSYLATALVGLLFAYSARALESGWQLALVSVLLILVVHGLGRSTLLRPLSLVLAIVLGVGPPAQWFLSFLSRDASQIVTPEAMELPPLESQPDVWVLVLDGYPSRWALENLFDGEETSLTRFLADSGFEVNSNALAPYPWTVAAVASVLEAQPIAPVGSSISQVEMAEVKSLLGGEAASFRTLDEAGYDIAVLESSWHLSRCEESVEFCRPSSWYDEAGASLWAQSGLQLIGPLRRGSAFPRGAFRVLDELRRMAEHRGNAPRLTFAHVIVPHPPIELASDCSYLRPGSTFDAGWLGHPNLDPDEVAARKGAFVEQLACVDSQIENLVASLPPDDVVVVFGDHGTDLLGQTALPPSEWSEDMFRERHLTMAATRIPGCNSHPIATIDLMQSVLSCMAGMDAPSPTQLSFSLPTMEENGRTGLVEPVPSHVLDDLMDLAREGLITG